MIKILLSIVASLSSLFPFFEFNNSSEEINSKTQENISNQEITLITTGDILLGRAVNIHTVASQNFIYPFEKTAELLKSADLTFINLEGPLVYGCPLKNSGLIFCGDTKNVEGLKYAGVDMVNLANNHTVNFGKKGLDDTIQALTREGIEITGISGPTYKEIKGTVFAFLGYNDIDLRNPYISFINEDKIKQEVQEASQKADLIIVAFHWGNEYQAQPSKRQKEIAYLAIDAGADLIVGNHPHWIQPIEKYKDKLIIYSHGNFIFDQYWSEKTREGLVGKISFYKNQIIKTEFFPVYIGSFGQPYFLEGEKQAPFNF